MLERLTFHRRRRRLTSEFNSAFYPSLTSRAGKPRTRPVVIDYCRWNEAVETTLRANTEAAFTLMFLWPRILLRAVTGV